MNSRLLEIDAVKPCQVARMDLWIDPVFNQMLNAEPGIQLETAKLSSPEQDIWRILEKAHVYQISAARDELPALYQVNRQLIEKCPSLMLVSSTGAGFDTVDVQACTEAGIAVVSQLGGNAPAVSEMAIGLMLAVSRRIVECDRKMKTETGFAREALMGHDISGKTLGLVGIGHTGARVAKLAKAFDMDILAFDPLLSPDQVRAKGAKQVDLETLLRRSDIVSVHCPRNGSTLNMFDEQRFKNMKQGSIFITTARGGIHDEQALYRALESGHLSGAGLDVWQVEPPPLNHPLLALPNVVATFHTAGVSHEGRRQVAKMAAELIIGVCNGQPIERVANPEVLKRFEERWKAALSACE